MEKKKHGRMEKKKEGREKGDKLGVWKEQEKEKETGEGGRGGRAGEERRGGEGKGDGVEGHAGKNRKKDTKYEKRKKKEERRKKNIIRTNSRTNNEEENMETKKKGPRKNWDQDKDSNLPHPSTPRSVPVSASSCDATPPHFHTVLHRLP